MIFFPLPQKNIYSTSSLSPSSYVTSFTPNKSNVYFDSSFYAVTSEPSL
jgi:hypothetical protein